LLIVRVAGEAGHAVGTGTVYRTDGRSGLDKPGLAIKAIIARGVASTASTSSSEHPITGL
jgi:hypothetical protein